MRLVLVVVVVIVIVAAAVIFFRSRRPIVIGAQLAEADARDRRHREQFGHLPSPLPQLRYDEHRGETTLIDPQVAGLDLQLRAISSRFAASSAQERGDLRNGATGDDFYTLLNFSRRASVFALRDRHESWIRDALNAVAMIDAARIDERDLPLTLSFVHHAAERLQLPSLKMFDVAAGLAEPRAAEIIRSFVRQSPTDKDIQASWGYQEIRTSSGPGFVQRGFDAYTPTRDLLAALLAVRGVIRSDRYEGDVTLATELPSVWFPRSARQTAEGILARSVGVGSVSGSLRPQEHERADVQSLLVFIVETRSEHDAAALQMLAESSPTEESATIGVHEGPLFALMVGRSFESGVASYETTESIKRFEGPLRVALREAGG